MLLSVYNLDVIKQLKLTAKLSWKSDMFFAIQGCLLFMLVTTGVGLFMLINSKYQLTCYQVPKTNCGQGDK